jgi:broad specificity phosphatase PhoE
MQKLILVRHSVPEIDPDVEAARWHLSAEGRRRCLALAHQLADHQPSVIVTSWEPKAMETGEMVAELLGLPWETAVGLHEHERHETGFVDSQEEFEARVVSIFEQPDRQTFGRETGNAARDRFAQAVRRVLNRHKDKTVGVVSHGTVITLYIAQAVGLEPAPFWKRLGMPAFVVLSLPDLALLAITEDVLQ